ncbi:condensation domain-containing protein [Streptomyces sp. NPDC001941]|uniref:condensation domain-containing protein n=1 Tax=Streptomyces sp. NPDC001941 TaxID=3154659 RepID=UPI003333379D
MGQANMIRCILRDDPVQINIHAVWPVPDGASVDAVADALGVLVARHEALRTTFPGAATTFPDEQVVAPEGEFTFTVRDHHGFTGDPGRHAETVARDARVERFRLDRDFPLRITLLSYDGVPRHLALAASHAATDGGALNVLYEEWRTLLGGGELPAPAALAPVDLALEERSPAGQRKSAAALRYWERVIRTGPQAMFAEPGVRPGDTATPQLTLRSLRAGRALAAAASRTGSPAQTVLLTAWCTLIGHRAGQRSCVAAAPTANRQRPNLARAVTTLSQDALLQLDLGGPTFDTVLRKAWGAALDAYRHSRFDSVQLWDMIGRTTHERGSQFARDVVFNDVSSVLATRTDTGGPGAAHPDLELSWGPEQELPSRALTFVYASEPALHLALWADPRLFDRQAAEGFLTGLVRLLEAVAVADVPLDALTGVTGVPAARRDERWRRVDGCWISPQAVTEALRTALGHFAPVKEGSEGNEGSGGPQVHVAVETPRVHVSVDAPSGPDAGADPELTAFIAAGDDSALTPTRAHAALMEVLPGRPELLAPHRYVIVPAPPSHPGDTAAWRRLPVLTEGSGRERPM